MDHRIEAIRQNWNERTPIHAASEFYNVEGFKKGRITLTDIERREVGDPSGKSLLHLQCHFGMDTMSWARLGADATGVDISDRAIELARSLNHELGLTARFIRSNLYDLPEVLHERFDIVYTAIGVLCWLPELTEWAKVVANFLKPDGIFYILDGHPFSHVFENEENGDGIQELQLRHSYFPDPDGIFYQGGGYTYTGTETVATESYEWQHSMSEIVNAIINAGMKLEFLHEFPVSCYKAFPNMQQEGDGYWRLPAHNDSLPQLFSLLASKE